MRSEAALSRPLVRGRAEVAFERRDGETRLFGLFHHDPLRVLFPHPRAGDPPTAVLATTSGGIVGGDRLDIHLRAGPGAQALAAAQAAEKVYRSAGPDCTVEMALEAAAGSRLEWLPQETILFDGARLRRLTRVDLEGDAGVLAGEFLVFGRIARGERFRTGLARDAWEVRLDGRLVWADALHLDGDCLSLLDHPACFGGAAALATILYAGPDAAGLLDRVRAAGTDAAVQQGATCLGPLLVVRLLGHDVLRLREAFGRTWAELRSLALGRPARLPRFWHV
jgi:urease accessory protein